MPPKKKPIGVTATTSTTNAAATTAAAAPTVVATPVTSTSSTTTNSSAAKIIKWYWAGDSTKGTQDTLVEYDEEVAEEIEDAYQNFQGNNKLDRMKIDKERYVDFTQMAQCRYDDPSKQRTIDRKEVDPNIPVQLALPQRVLKKKAAVKKGTKRSANDSDDDVDVGDGSQNGLVPAIGGGISTSLTTTSTTTSTTKQAKKKKKKAVSSDDSDSSENDSDSDDEDYHATWYWAGDSAGGGHQDMWVKYDSAFAKKLEKAYVKNKPKVKVDSDRFCDMQNMLQRRYDDENKRRMLKREDPIKASKAKPGKPTSSTTTTTTTTPTSTTSTTSTSPSTANSITTNGSTNANTAPMSQSLAISQALKCPSTWVDVSMDYKEVDVYPHTAEFDWMSDLFSKTIASNHKNTMTLSPIIFKDLKVTRVVRIQNASLWLRYNHRKEKIIQDNNGKCTKVDKIISNLSNGPDVDKDANECFLFHGLNVSSITGITKFGFDPRFCSLEGMFGAGLYFAENSSKSNQYCHAGACTSSGFKANNCKCTQKDEVCLLVCRVILGETLVENVFRGNNPGEFWHGRRTEPKRPDGVNIYNSVVGESKANHGSKATLQLREYIVYESGQVYPEYKVYYKRIK
ncbi:poly(ADP-ribose) polymerase [Cavenderia fasciculata]|uniref:Poly [ADP-ribose] polymerase n=1 Tax=Cavenderia fasciculata TaxID=261658 RepID=F4Q1E4_CACFS|nr:poly(ADP-ribose) polymerase [Cavenderia fasciculata]EGG18645.1 poly(ADP-ribose) polymerase [Cavenderia fasciculata]|eukprot:XP_004366549.1 poly(ADP-ribose) polymerase [Cavenderia fasciculata]